MTDSLKLLTALIGLVVAVIELHHAIAGTGPSVVATVSHVVGTAPEVVWPERTEIESDIPKNVDEFNDMWDSILEEEKERHADRTPPTPPDWWTDDSWPSPPSS